MSSDIYIGLVARPCYTTKFVLGFVTYRLALRLTRFRSHLEIV